ncbi:MAG: cytochrome c [Acidobacteriota bacterium]|nr:cytochrome c [Acidobacteriota bacterium]
MQFPDAPGRETVQKVCGGCHGAEVVVQKGLSRQQWGQVIASMVTRGAKGTDDEFTEVLNYLAKNFPATASAAANTTAPTRPRRGPGAGSNDQQVVDKAAADRGRATYAAQCIDCHGPKARGNDNGADLVRSLTVLHDRYGNTIGPFLKKGHFMQGGGLSAKLTQAQIEDLSHFLHARVDDTLRSGPFSQVINVLTGDAKSGAEYFNGAGKCSSCHSPTVDLAGIAKKYDPPTLQQRFLFPQSVGFSRGGVSRAKPVTVTVTSTSVPSVSGVLLSLDDFDVSLRDSTGEYHSWKRTPDLKVERNNPYAAHIDLLDQYSDKNIHDVVAYLETLK